MNGLLKWVSLVATAVCVGCAALTSFEGNLRITPTSLDARWSAATNAPASIIAK